MKRSNLILTLGIVLASVCGMQSSVDAATMELSIDTGGVSAAPGTPVKGGVPFAMGELRSLANLQLRSQQGSVIPANFHRLAGWPDGSIKAVLVSFVPDVGGSNYSDVVLHYGSGVSRSDTGAVRVSESSSTLTVTTDRLKLEFSKDRFSVIEQAYTDLNGNGSFESSEAWLNRPGDLVFVDRRTGNTFRSSLWRSGDGFAPRLHEAGDRKVTVLLEGRVRGESGAKNAYGKDTLLQAKVWLTLYAGSTQVDIQTTFIDDVSHNTEHFDHKIIHLDKVALELPTKLTGASYSAGGQSRLHQGSVGGKAVLLQDAVTTWTGGGFDYDFNYSGVGSGERAPGWMDVSAGGRGIAMGIQHFWQDYPHQLRAEGDGTVALDFLPIESVNDFWTVYPGVGKTYKGFIDLHAGGFQTDVENRALMALRPVLLRAPAKAFADSEALGPVLPPSSETGHWETKMANQYNCTALRTGCSIYPQLYGQRNYGDYIQGLGTNRDGSKFANYGDGHYEDAHGFLLQYVRTGDRKWFDHAMGFAMHHYDLDVMHTENPPRYNGFPPGMMHWHGTAEHEGVNIEFGHIVPGGLYEMYMLTGDPRALEVMKEQADWVAHWARIGRGRIAPERDDDEVGLEEYERVGAWTLYTLMKTYEATGDPKYWDAATILVKNTIDWWKMPQDHIVFDGGQQIDQSREPKDQAVYYQRSDWTQGTGYPLPTLRVANCPSTSANISVYKYQTHVPIAWMSGLLQTAMIRYYQHLERKGGVYSDTIYYRWRDTPISVDTATMREMFIQMLNMITTHNYAGASNYPSKYPWVKDLDYQHFIYSACPGRDPRVEDGGQYLAWPLTFVSSFTQDQVSDRWKGQWSELQTRFREIAQIQYKRLFVDKPGPLPGYNGAPAMWNMPFALAQMEKLNLLSSFPTPPPPSSGGGSGGSGGGGSTPPPPPASSDPLYQVSVNGGNPFITDPLIIVNIAAPSAATEVNLSTEGWGAGTWQAIEPAIEFTVPDVAGAVPLYVRFRNDAGDTLASLANSLVLLKPGFEGTVELVINDVEDTYVFENQGGNNFAAQPTMTAGKYADGYQNYALLDFNLPALPEGLAVQIDDAYLDLYLTQNTRNTHQDLSPYVITEAWSENTVTWNSRPALSAQPLGASVPFYSRGEIWNWKRFALNSARLQDGLIDPDTFHGIAIAGEGTPGMTSLQFRTSEDIQPSRDYRAQLHLVLTISGNDDTAPEIVGEVEVVDIGETSATVRWTTSEPANGFVEYGETSLYGSQSAPLNAFTTEHQIVVDDLEGETLYHLKVTSSDAAGNAVESEDVTFSTMGAMAGDLNGDGRLNQDDIDVLAARVSEGGSEPMEICDVNQDGAVNVLDVQALSNLVEDLN